jgi:hypothetical protein
MIVFKKAIPRRAMLRGMGAALALPLLDSMVPAFSALAATPAKPVNRFGVVYIPNGMIMQNYLPATEGRDYELTPTLSALASVREHVQVLSGLNCIPTPGHLAAHERNLARRGHFHGSDPGPRNRQAHATGVARTGHRIRRNRGRLRYRLRLPLYEYDLLERPQHPAANAE